MDYNDRIDYFTFYDLETYGLDVRRDRIAQFAAIRTDANFKILEKAVFYCLPQQDYIPHLQSMLVTGITPEDTETIYRKNAYKENEFINKVIGFLSKPNNCVLGYNNIKFDDEYLRFTAFRNFYDPYSFNTDFRTNSTRWDLINLVRACHALSPEEINWPNNPEGEGISMRLEHMSKANNLSHEHAHDALSDVEATIQLAKLIHDLKPRLFDYFFKIRTKRKIEEEFYDYETCTFKKSPLVHVDTCYGFDTLYTAVILPLELRKEKGSYIYGWRIDQDLSSLTALFDKLDQLNPSNIDWKQIGLVKINIARSPALSEFSVIKNRPQRAERLHIDLNLVAKNLELLEEKQNYIKLLDQLIEIDKVRFAEEADPDPETMLYQLIDLTPQDRNYKNEIHEREAKDPFVFDEITFSNSTLRRLLFRYKARNFAQYLNEKEVLKWNNHLVPYLEERIKELQEEINTEINNNFENIDNLKLILKIINYYSKDGCEVADQDTISDLVQHIKDLEKHKKKAQEEQEQTEQKS